MKCLRLTAFALCVSAAVVFATGCNSSNKTTAKSQSATAMGAMNDKCPMSGMAANASHFSTYDGKKIAFCCANCQRKFEAMTDAEKAETVAKISAN